MTCHDERPADSEAARLSQKLLRSVFDNMPAAYLRADGEDRLVVASPSAARLYGYDSPHDMMGLPAESLYAETAARQGIVAQLRETGRVVDYVTLARRKDGSTFRASLDMRVVRDEEGNVVGTEGFVCDIGERKRAEEAPREGESRFRTLIDRAPVAIGVSRDGIGLYANQKFVETFGLDSVSESVGRPISEYVAPQSREESREYIRRRSRGLPSPTEFETLGLRKDGSQFPVQVVVARVPLSDGMANVAFLTDITERKQAEAERARLEAQLQQAQKMESVGRLAGGVAHDFNNMLGVILGHAELALQQLDPTQPLFADLQEVQQAAERSAELTRRLLAFARKQTIAPQVLDLNAVIEASLNLLRRMIGADIDLLWRPGAHPWLVKVDPSQVDQVLANLCVNARDAIGGAGKVTIETETATFDDAYCANHPGSLPGEYVRLAVSDDGCGMEKGTLSRLFEPFFTTKALGAGTGLGLATVYGIVKQNQGFIDVYSEPGIGTIFTIYLPRHVEAGQAWTKRATEPAVRGHETILVVEDDPAVLKVTTRLLAGQGYTVLAAGSPIEAIRWAGECASEIHLLMTDVIMPVMNGRELAAQLLSLHPHLKRLYTSGYTADVIAHHGVLDEGVQFLQKPFSVNDLAAKVREVLDET